MSEEPKQANEPKQADEPKDEDEVLEPEDVVSFAAEDAMVENAAESAK